MNTVGKRVLVVGLGESGRAAVRFFAARGAVVSAVDQQPEERLAAAAEELRSLGAKLFLGGHHEEIFLDQGLIVPSPGVPWDLPALQAARRRGIDVMGELEVAAGLLSGPVIGITGTNGKTTTTALIGHILTSAGWKARTGGNLGTPVLAMIDSGTSDTWNVLELSSFQLEAAQHFLVHIAVVLNVTPDHLDRHRTMEAYTAAKARILLAQGPDHHAVLNADDKGCHQLASQAHGRVCWFSRTQPVSEGADLRDGWICFGGKRVMETKLPIRGAHNLENALAAVAAASLAGVSRRAIAAAVPTFQPVEHRLEFVRELAGVAYYNDSKATNVDASIKAIEAFEGGLWVILGGSDKGADYSELRRPLRDRARAALLIGHSAAKLEQQLEGAVSCHRVETLPRAVELARRKAQPGDTILLAPACASFDQFDNYGHRGRVFKELVHALE
jgi:UDP-N-acetylmuramoylalanine--D-glutamate ligase